jgi:hypothetical protein
MYYVRCNTRSSGASARGTPRQAVDYITDAHDAERDPSYSHAELAYIARLDPGWKTDLEGGRVPLVGLGALAGSSDPVVLAAEFEQACQPYHDRRGTTGYLSYTFTMPKELSLVAEGHPVRSRQAMYAALQSSLDIAFAGKEYRAVTAIHTRNEAGEVHYHAHVLVGKFTRDSGSGRVFSLNSRSGGNTGKIRLKALKEAWKHNLDAALKERLGLTIMQSSPYARPALTLADGTYVPALNRESRRILDKHLCFRLSDTTSAGATRTKNFRWTHFDPTIYELASSGRAGGWSAAAFCDLFPELAGRLRTYESRVATLKRIGYLTGDRCVHTALPRAQGGPPGAPASPRRSAQAGPTGEEDPAWRRGRSCPARRSAAGVCVLPGSPPALGTSAHRGRPGRRSLARAASPPATAQTAGAARRGHRRSQSQRATQQLPGSGRPEDPEPVPFGNQLGGELDERRPAANDDDQARGGQGDGRFEATPARHGPRLHVQRPTHSRSQGWIFSMVSPTDP